MVIACYLLYLQDEYIRVNHDIAVIVFVGTPTVDHCELRLFARTHGFWCFCSQTFNMLSITLTLVLLFSGLFPGHVISWMEECDLLSVDGCMCTKYSYNTVMDCKGIGLDVVPPIAVIGDDSHAEGILLDLSDNNFTLLVSFSAVHVSVAELIITHNRQPLMLADDALSADQKADLIYLDLSNDRLEHIPGLLKNMSNLQSLDLSFNRIRHVREDDLRGLLDLRRLELKGNPLQTIAPYEFYYISFLNDLSLTFDNETVRDASEVGDILGPGNTYKGTLLSLEISHVNLVRDVHFLNGFQYLDYLRLAYCGITDAIITATGVLTAVNAMKYIDLSRNQISQFPDQFLSNAVHLEHLDLSYNNFTSDFRYLLIFCSSLPELTYLDLSHNNITNPAYYQTADTSEFPKLTELILSHNRIALTGRTFFHGLPMLERLDLSHNRIRLNFHGSYHNLPNLKHLDLSNNEFVFFHQNAFPDPLPGSLTMSIVGNPFQCLCGTKWLVDAIGSQDFYGEGLFEWYDVYNTKCSTINPENWTMIDVYNNHYGMFDRCDL